MIKNARQYYITKESIGRLEEALAHAKDSSAQRDPLFQQALRNSLEGEIEVRRRQLAEYVTRHGGEPGAPELFGDVDIPDLLIRARLTKGITPESLARRVGLTAEDIRHFEETGYADIELGWARSIARALGYEITALSNPPDDEDGAASTDSSAMAHPASTTRDGPGQF